MRCLSIVAIQPGLCPGPRQGHDALGTHNLYILNALCFLKPGRNGGPPPFRTIPRHFRVFYVFEYTFLDESQWKV